LVVKTLRARDFEASLADTAWVKNVATKPAAGRTEYDYHTHIGLIHHSIDTIVQYLTPELAKR